MKTSKILLAAALIAAVFGLVGFSYAHGGYGLRGYHMGSDYGSHMGYRGCSGYDRYSGMSDEQTENLAKMRSEFLAETHTLRDDIYQKRLEMRSELAKQNPDTGELKSIQRELSRLEAELDQKRLAYDLERNKIASDGNRAFSGRNFSGPCWE